MRALSGGPMGVTEIADTAELPKSTVARLLNALEAEGAVVQDMDGSDYRLGDTIIDLAGSARPGRNLVATARQILVELAARVGETAGISVRDGGDIYYLDHVSVDSEVQVRDWTGEYAPMHTVPSGLVLLAHMPKAEVTDYIDAGLHPSTIQTTTDPTKLRQRLREVASHGYAWGYEEFVDGINSVAAPVMDADGTAIAAVHVHAPAYRFPDPDDSHDIALAVIEAANAVSEQLSDS